MKRKEKMCLAFVNIMQEKMGKYIYREIPKTIHYCWFGGNELTPLAKQCLNSWKKYCPEYEIIEWNEKNFDITSNCFVKEAYKHRKWAFVSDYVRVFVLYNYGGVYIDADGELIKNISDLLKNKEAITGYEGKLWIPAALMAALPNNMWIKSLLDYYDNRHFVLKDGSLDTKPNTAIITEISQRDFNFSLGDKYIKKGNVHLMPAEYFTPEKTNPIIKGGKATFKIDPENTFLIHHFAGSWAEQSVSASLIWSVKAILYRILPLKIYEAIKKHYYAWFKWKKK